MTLIQRQTTPTVYHARGHINLWVRSQGIAHNTMQSITRHNTAQQSTAPHSTAQHSSAAQQRSTAAQHSSKAEAESCEMECKRA